MTFSEMMQMCDASTQEKLGGIQKELGSFISMTNNVANATGQSTNSEPEVEVVKDEDVEVVEETRGTSSTSPQTTEVARSSNTTSQGSYTSQSNTSSQGSYTNQGGTSPQTVEQPPVRSYTTKEINGTVYAIDDEAEEEEPIREEPTKENVRRFVKKIFKGEPAYCKKREYAQPATAKEIEDLQKTIDMLTKRLDDAEQLNNFKKKIEKIDLTKLTKKEEETAKTIYKKDSCIVNGKTVSFKRVKMEPDWNHILDASMGASKERNFDNLRSLITEDLKNQLGGWKRVTTIYVYDSQLIVNGICFMPVLKGIDTTGFPMDTVDYIKNGAIAPLFDWSSLKKMGRLTELSFDDATFMYTSVSDDLGLGRRMGVSSLFKVCDGLMTLTYGDTTITREDLKNPEKAKKAVESLAVTRRKVNILDGFHLDVYAGTEGFRSYTFNNLKNFATNRNGQGFLRFGLGVVGRTGLAALGLGIDFGAHVVGAIKNVVTDAINPVSDEELYKDNSSDE